MRDNQDWDRKKNRRERENEARASKDIDEVGSLRHHKKASVV